MEKVKLVLKKGDYVHVKTAGEIVRGVIVKVYLDGTAYLFTGFKQAMPMRMLSYYVVDRMSFKEKLSFQYKTIRQFLNL